VNAFLLNLLLALFWAAMNGEFRPANLAFGFAIGYVILYVAQPMVGRSSYFLKVRQATEFAAFYVWELVLSTLQVAIDVATPRFSMRPAILAIPLDATTDEEITALANLTAMTPGTLPLDVSEDRTVLYIHALYASDPDAVRRAMKNFERRVLELLR
jgi:multicomponent Na+:H+ antiporter subunit E